jgi:hypothetical protein
MPSSADCLLMGIATMTHQPENPLLDSIVRNHVGSGPRWFRYNRRDPSAMNTVLDIAQQRIPRDFAMYWVYEGLPENVSFPSLDPPLVIFSTRYVEMVGYLRGMMTIQSSDDLLREQESERVSLRIIAELLLKYGDPSIACYLFVKSLLHERVVIVPPSLDELDFADKDWAYMTIWYFAVLHELGHIRAEHGGETDFDRTLLKDWVKRTAEQLDPEMNQRDFVESFDVEILATEQMADDFAVSVIWDSAKELIDFGEAPGGNRGGDFAAEILLMLNVYAYLNNCALAARISADRSLNLAVVR